MKFVKNWIIPPIVVASLHYAGEDIDSGSDVGTLVDSVDNIVLVVIFDCVTVGGIWNDLDVDLHMDADAGYDIYFCFDSDYDSGSDYDYDSVAAAAVAVVVDKYLLIWLHAKFDYLMTKTVAPYYLP
tara:strand:- start:20 stop:400 length:381 start_codon:yes stop_codon:yes gene_type:complete